MALSRIVAVGLDGSPDARAALRYAVAEARPRGAQLKVVAAYAFPEYSALGQPYPVLATPEEIETDVIAAIRPIVNRAARRRQPRLPHGARSPRPAEQT